MTNQEILNSDELSLPKIRTNDNFVEFATTVINDYLNIIKQFDREENIFIEKNWNSIDFLCGKLVKSIEEYYNGYISKSFDLFSQGIEEIKKFLWIPKEDGAKHMGIINLYKIRPNKNSLKINAAGMFHIPFHQREMSKSYRFSIPGFPCLYLGDSIYTCWEELTRIRKGFSVSRFEIQDSLLNIVDISILSKHMGNFYIELQEANLQNKTSQIINNHIVSWPLKALCYIKTKTHFEFKPEYIIPQHLMQWVRLNNEHIDGIKYNSTKIENSFFNSFEDHINYAFPVKNISDKGLCSDLKSKIKVTEPIHFNNKIDLRKKLKVRQCSKDHIINYSMQCSKRILMVGKSKTVYWDSIFGELEEQLIKKTAKKLE